jgi:hypothetical protein
MWVSFPISRRSRVVVPWFVAVPLIPLAAGLWVVGLTFDVLRWVWTRPHRRPPSCGATIRVRVDA